MLPKLKLETPPHSIPYYIVQDKGDDEGDSQDGDAEQGEGDNGDDVDGDNGDDDETKEKEGFESLAPDDEGEDEGREELKEDEDQPQVNISMAPSSPSSPLALSITEI